MTEFDRKNIAVTRDHELKVYFHLPTAYQKGYCL